MTKSKRNVRQHASPPEPKEAARPLAAPPRVIALVLVVFAIVFATLSVGSYRQESATWDEPIHLAMGYAALTRHDYRVDPEHPPFLRMWAALPLLTIRGITLDTSAIDQSSPSEWAEAKLYLFSRRFLYVDNDADRLLYAARFMVVLLGIGLGVLLFCWANEWLGFRPAVAALGLYLIEPNVAAHASLVTTDFGVACFIFGTIYFLWRTCRRPSAGNITGLTIFLTLSVISKFSALLLGPLVVLLLALGVWRRTLTAARAAALMALLAGAAWIAIWAIYGFRYAPSASPAWLFQLQHDANVQAQTPGLARIAAWIDGHHLLPNVFTQGLLISQAKAQWRAAFLAGSFSMQGWWYYFPIAFLIKTPITLILLFGGGLVLATRRRSAGIDVDVDDGAFVGLPIAVFLGSAMLAHLNIGLRHILMIYPFVLMVAAAAARALLARKGEAVLGILLAAGLMEFATVYPHTLAFFNQFVGGPGNGSKYLVDSNIDWGQDLKLLKGWMQEHGVRHINLAYFGSADPAYYHIDATHLPVQPNVFGDPVELPQLPGYVAVSVTELSGVYFNAQWCDFYQPLRDRVPAANIGYSIRVYWVDRPWFKRGLGSPGPVRMGQIW